jgi:hypothetical protein
MFIERCGEVFFNRTYRLFSEYSAMLHIFGNILLLWNTRHEPLCESVIEKKGFCWLKESPPPRCGEVVVDLVTPVSSAVWESVHTVIVATYIKTKYVLCIGMGK